MKHTCLKFTTAILLLFSTVTVTAQKEIIEDLIPYRKGNLWGLMHHNMTEFYPPVFDSILIRERLDKKFSVFYKNGDGQNVADVIHEGKRKYLTTAKELIPYKEEKASDQEDEDRVIIASLENEGNIVVPQLIGESSGSESQNKQPVVLETISHPGWGNDIEVRKSGKTIMFYIENEIIPEFTCVKYSRCRDRNGKPSPLVILTNSAQKEALAHLLQKKLILPFEYDYMYLYETSDLLMVRKNKQNGLISTDGKIIMPVKYTKIDYIRGPRIVDNSDLLVVNDNGSYYFAILNDGKVSSSAIRYDRLAYFIYYGRYFFIVVKSGKAGIVTSDDKIAIPFEYDRIEKSKYDFIMLYKDNKVGFLCSWRDFFIKKPIYDELSPPIMTTFKKDRDRSYYLLLATKNGKTFYMDEFGTEFIAP